MINVPDEVREIQRETGWTDDTLLLLALRFIDDSPEGIDGFLDFLREQQAEEDEECNPRE